MLVAKISLSNYFLTISSQVLEIIMPKRSASDTDIVDNKAKRKAIKPGAKINLNHGSNTVAKKDSSQTGPEEAKVRINCLLHI